ncbi:MAG: polysaccharide deacetylase family protein [Candidatus Pacearchaeota archaeon]
MDIFRIKRLLKLFLFGLVIVFLVLHILTTFFFYFNLNKNIENKDKENKEEEISKNKGIISLVFDDGLESQYSIAFQKMRHYEFNGTLFLLANQTGFLEGRKLMNFEKAKEMQDHGWEIGNHGLKHEPIKESNLFEQLIISKKILESKGFFINTFACPTGCNESIKSLREIGNKNYLTVRSLDWGENNLSSYSRQKLNSKWVNKKNNGEEICKWIIDASKRNNWLILIFHGIEEKKPRHLYDISEDDFNKILDCINENKIKTKTISEVLKNE